MDWIEKINKVLKYIEEHLMKKIDYNAITKMIYCSLPQFQQMFLLSCGVTVSEYIRLRRMTEAVLVLLDTDFKVIDLSILLNYSYTPKFNKSIFRRE